MKLRKSSKIEISKITLGILVAGVFSLLGVCIPLVYNTSETIEIELLNKEASLDKELNQCQRIGTNLENTSKVLIESSERIKMLGYSSEIFKKQKFSDDEIRRFLLQSSKKRFQIKESINLVDAQVEDSGLYVNTYRTNETLRKLLDKEYDIWLSFEKFLLENDSADWKKSEIQFKSFDDNLLKWYELVNQYNNMHIKHLAKYNNITSQLEYSEKKFDTRLNNLNYIRTLGRIGIILTVLILIPLLRLTFRKTVKM